MTYDDFSNKLHEIKCEYEAAKKRKLETVRELELFLIERKNRSRSKGIKTLRGLDL